MQIDPDQAEERIAATPDAVWRIVSDVTRIPEWSPQCHRAEWLDGATGPATGARFRGHNRRRGFTWSRECRVSECDPGRAFAFSTWSGDREETRWRYDLRPSEGGTLVTESFSVVGAPAYIKVMNALVGKFAVRDRHANLTESLARLKTIAERDASRPA